MKKNILAFSALFLTISFSAFSALAESDEDSAINEVESIFEKETLKEEDVAPTTKEESHYEALSSLKNLQPFKDIAVIQRKFLPKTKRFETFLGAGAIVNNAFFLNFGLMGQLSYHFNETWGMEFSFKSLNNSQRQVTEDLRTYHGVFTNGLVAPDKYYGADIVWTPVYGKVALLDNNILPFDLYFGLGGGLTSTNQGESAPTIHISAGQRFAISKGMAFRWDFSWNFYSASYKVENSAQTLKGQFDNLFLTIGMSFFFPEATYR